MARVPSTLSVNINQELGMPTVGRPITTTLYVSKSGDNSNGSSWDKAYNTLNAALNAASTDADVVTAILLAPTETYYDIDTAGDPTWSANVEIIGSHRRWSPIRNTNASATSVLKLTGKASLVNCAISQVDCVTGIIMTGSACRIRKCGFNSEACGQAVTAIKIDGTASDITGAIIEDIKLLGNQTYTTGLEIINCDTNDFMHMHIHDCLQGINISGANSTNNIFENLDIGLCTTGIKIAGGTGEHFYDVNFHGNTLNIDDDVDSNIWNNIRGEFTTAMFPENLDGIEVTAGDDVWGADTELRSSATATKPFKVLSYHLAPSNDETTIIKFSADSGATYFNQSVFASKKDKATSSGDATDFIFNAGTRISASIWSPSAGRTVNVWIEIQEI